jgi:MFS transporter, DHA3 family, macrolide efflux protein
VLLLGAVIGLVLGLLLGGRVDSLINVRLRFAALIGFALALRFGTQFAVANGVAIADALRLPLYLGAFAVLVGALWLNRNHAGLLLVAVGAASNGLAIAANGGWMPVYLPALAASGLTPGDLSATFHRPLPDDLGLEFLLRAGPLGDVLPFPVPVLTNLVSIGDVVIAVGLGWFVFTTLLRGDPSPERGGISLWRGDPPPAEVSLDRPVLLGGTRAAARPRAAARDGAAAAWRHHPYVRLALDARFSAFWLAQTISMLGDRLHQIALGVLVYEVTDSALLTGLVFLAATLPNVLLGPIAGTFVDRWDHKKVLIASDLGRAALVLAVPLAIGRDVALVYPLVFLITTVSLFFRPAKAAVVPRIVKPDDLLAANSATWTGETLADLAGYPLAGLFVAILGTELALAFWVDSASYLLSALLLVGLTIPPAVRTTRAAGGALRSFAADLAGGWRVLRRQPALFHNTLVSTLAQLAVGATIALAVVYGRDALDGTLLPYPQNYAAIEAAIGLGNLVGGFAVGLLGARVGKGRLIVGGFLAMGLGTVVLGLTVNVGVAIVASVVIGIANLVYVIPTQTLFGELVPEGYMGRVVAMRSSMVFGAMTGAMAVSGVLAEAFDVGLVIAAFGVVTVVAGLIAALLPSIRDS